MQDELAKLIDDYLAVAAVAVAAFNRRFKSTNPMDVHASGRCPDAGAFDDRELGHFCYIFSPEESYCGFTWPGAQIDVVFGPRGETQDFDARRLWLFGYRKRLAYPTVARAKSERPVQAELSQMAEAEQLILTTWYADRPVYRKSAVDPRQMLMPWMA